MEDNSNRNPDSEGNRRPRKKGFVSKIITAVIVLGIAVILCANLLPIGRSAPASARRAQCMNNLHQIAVALHGYANAHGALPPAYTTDADGKPLHSWRTLILPFMEQNALYEIIDLSKPWDDPVNAKACAASVDVYQCPSARFSDNRTTYLAVVTTSSCFQPTEPRKLSDITDGAGQTLLLIEVDLGHAVPWMSPVDADEQLVLGIGTKLELLHPGTILAAFVDGHVQALSNELLSTQRLALISIAGNDQAAVGEQY